MLDGNDKEAGTIETTVTAQRQGVTEETTCSPDKEKVADVFNNEDGSKMKKMKRLSFPRISL